MLIILITSFPKSSFSMYGYVLDFLPGCTSKSISGCFKQLAGMFRCKMFFNVLKFFWVGLYDGSDLKTYLLMRWWEPAALAVCRAHQGLPVGFFVLRYSVLFTVESLSLLYLLVIPWFICFWRWCIDKLGVFHANQISMCLDPHLN